MSATVSERPSGEQPALREDSHPYPQDPTFTPRTGPLAVRTPGAYVAAHPAGRPPFAHPQSDLALLARVSDSLRNEARDGEGIFATAVAEHYRTGPRPESVPAEPAVDLPPGPAPVPGWPEGTVRGLLIAALWSAARWYGAMDGAACEQCEAEAGLCAWHAERQVKAVGCEKLHDCVAGAPSDAGAVALVTGVLRSGRLSVGDLAFSRSPLEGILADALGTNGGAE